MAKNDNPLVGTRIKPVPVEKPEIGIDTSGTLEKDVVDSVESSTFNLNKLDAFTRVAQSRDTVYGTIDTMCQDSTLAAVLETYTEDVCEPADSGKIMWCESNESDVGKYVTYLLDSLNVDKNIYGWTNKLIKYGDLYLRLFRKSEFDNDLIFGDEKSKKDSLTEDINLRLSNKSDHYVHFVEAMENPAEVFELTKHGKSMGYILAPVNVQKFLTDDKLDPMYGGGMMYMRYNVKRQDINIFPATEFVHACLEDSSCRTAEEVDISIDQGEDRDPLTANYKVRRGQSLFNDVFKVWREMTLLENSVLLNRITRSSLVRIINVPINDMPKEQVRPYIQRLKEKIEQKSGLDVGSQLQEYINPGPIENTIYVPQNGEQGAISVQTLGGDVDPKQLTDLDWFNNKMFASLRVPKQFFGFTDDAAGFSGGESLAIISSRYGKAIKRIQNTLCQAITDIINLYLLDKGLSSYINKFTIKMQAPVTKDEIQRRETADNRIRYTGDIMSQLSDIEDQAAKLKILKILLSQSINDPQVIAVLDEQIQKLEEAQENNGAEETAGGEEDLGGFEEGPDLGGGGGLSLGDLGSGGEEMPAMGEEGPVEETPEGGEEMPAGGNDSYMPSGEELGVDLTSM